MRLPPWLWRVMKSGKTRILLACSPFVVCALVAASYPVCGWIGRWQVKRHVADLERAGYAVDIEKYYVPASSPDRDVFQHPAMIREMAEPKVIELWDRKPQIAGLVRRKPRIEREFAIASDIRTWVTPPESDEKLAAKRLLAELEEPIKQVQELRHALERPEAAWQVRWMKNEYTQGQKFPDVAFSLFRLRTLSRFQADLIPLYLADGDTAAASECARSMIGICQHYLDSRPSIISLLMGAAEFGVIENGLWEGLVRGAWTEEQLAGFEMQLAKLDPQRSASRSFLGEVALARFASQKLLEDASKPRPKEDLFWTQGWEWSRDRIEGRTRALWRGVRPRGIELMKWVEAERIFIGQLSTHDSAVRTRFTAADLAFFQHREASRPPVYFVSGSGLSLIGDRKDLDTEAWGRLKNIATSVLRLETKINLTRTAIALERYRRANGDIPTSLDALIPDYLPALLPDPFDDKPLRYRRQADGSPHLWSVGEDGIDEGGLPSSRQQKGDMVWITRPIPGFTKKELRR